MNDQPRQSPGENGDAPLAEAHALIAALQEDQLEPAQVERLEQLVRSDLKVRRLYVKCLHQRCAVAAMSHGATSASLDDVSTDSSLEMPAVLRPISDPVEHPVPRLWQDDDEAEHAPRVRGTRYIPKRTRWSPSNWLLKAAAIILLIIGITVAYQRWPSRPTPTPPAVAQAPAPPSPLPQSEVVVPPAPVHVAKLTREYQARWAQPADTNDLQDNVTLSLTEGLAELTFATGATVVIEAPSQFTVRHNTIELPAGKLAATITPSATGFTVNTPQSTIVDLGTEFGVTVSKTGETRVDVFNGRVTARPANNPTTAPVELLAGKAAAVTGGKVNVDPRGALPQRFVRRVTSTATTLDVVDLISGGDGTTHRRGTAIDMFTGKFGELAPRGTIQGKNAYHRVDLDVIDGCFVPNGQTQVDSKGSRFNFGRTQARTFDHIRAGGKFKWSRADSAAQFSAVLGGVNYGSASHGFLFLHASSGITLDLNAIRRLHPGREINRFQSLLGNTAEGNRGTKQPPETTGWVIVDGKQRFKQTFTNKNKPINVDVEIKRGDRFLTLATSDSTDSNHLDWVIFADPRLNLEARQK